MSAESTGLESLARFLLRSEAIASSRIEGLQAALVHAQFETIHPYVDGNGRVGRALLHTILARRGLTPTAVLPVSLVLLTRSADYVAALTTYRHTGSPSERPAADALAVWIDLFLDATTVAVDQAATFARQLAELRAEWHERLSASRSERGTRERPRADSAVARLIEVFDLLTGAERRLASTRWDTRQSAPVRPVPARPQHRA